MQSIDFDRHNAEVQELWAAYRARAPYRVPCIWGTNTRYFLLGENAPFGNVSFEEYTKDPDVMFEVQVRFQDWLRHHVPQDAPMGLPREDEGWSVHVDFQNYTEAAWFGCEIEFRDGQVPDTRPRWQNDDRKREILDRGIPDVYGGQMAVNERFYSHFLERAKSYRFKGLPVCSVSPRGLGTDGPLTVAANIRGASELFLDFIEDPDYVRQLLALITEATIARIKAWRKRIGQPEKSAAFSLADDSVQLLSTEMYREFVLPCHQRLRAALSTAETGGGIHLCGDSTRHFVTIRDELGIDSFDTGFPVDFAKLRSELGPDVEIKGGPHIELLRSGTPERVGACAREVLESGVTEGGRFILREGNNLAPGTPLANLEAMYNAARAYGRYACAKT